MYFENKLTENQSNIKKTWEIIREATKKMNDKSSIIDQIIIGDETIEDNQKIAESFNDHFCSIPGKIAEKIIPTDHPPDENFTQSEHTFELDDIGPEFIIELVKNLKSKTSLDSTELSCKFIKVIINEILNKDTSHTN